MKAKNAAFSIFGNEKFSQEKHRTKLYNVLKNEFNSRQDRELNETNIRSLILTNMDSFKNYISEMRDYFNAISRKTCGGLPEKEWNYFFAKVVVPFRTLNYPEEAARIQKHWDDKNSES